MKNEWRLLVGVCAVVLAVYAYMAHSGYFVSSSLNTSDEYYNLLVQGFRAGQLNLKTEVPPGLARLADPYDPAAHAPYPVLDMSYFKGKLYLYFGATPALALFWPYLALTGDYLSQKNAAVIFCFIGFVVGVGLLWALWRRYFTEVNVVVVAAGALALGLGTCAPLLLARCDVFEVCISCGYAFTWLALGAIWKALHYPTQRGRWLAAASVAYGLAVGARPSLLLGAVILLIPVVQTWRERRPIWVTLIAAVTPIMVIGIGLMLYNAMRFDNPFDFGFRCQLSGVRQFTQHFFSLNYLWFNFRVYFLEPARWVAHFPFVHGIVAPPLPAGHISIEDPFGILTNVPLVWLALAVPLAWRDRSGPEAWTLRWFVLAVALLFGINALTLGFYYNAADRYEVEFVPPLMLMAVIGIMSLERALAQQKGQRCLVRGGWSLLLVFSVVFNVFAGIEHSAEAYNNRGYFLRQQGLVQAEIEQYMQALRFNPDFVEPHYNLGVALEKTGRLREAIGQYEEAVRRSPDFVEARFNLAVALERAGQVQQAIGQYEQVLSLKPDHAAAHSNLGAVLFGQGQYEEAVKQYEAALRTNPDYPETHVNLGNVFLSQGNAPNAMAQYEEALRIKPDYAEAHMSLGNALLLQSHTQDAIVQYEEALRIKPDYPQAHDNLGIALGKSGRIPEAMKHWEEALRLRPDDVEAHVNLGNALQTEGRVPEAIEHYQLALKLRPDCGPAKKALAKLQAGQTNQ